MKPFWALIAGVCVVWLATPFAVRLAVGPDAAAMGQAGDLFGAATSLFSGLAFAGLFWALRLQANQLTLQRAELRLQRQELRMQREEMAASRQELARQTEAQRAQYTATAAHVAVAAATFEMEAVKFTSAQTPDRGKFIFAQDALALARKMADLHTSLIGSQPGAHSETAAS